MEGRYCEETGRGGKARKVCRTLFGAGVEAHELAVAHVREVKTARRGIEAGVIEASGATRQRDVGHLLQKFCGKAMEGGQAGGKEKESEARNGECRTQSAECVTATLEGGLPESNIAEEAE